MKSEERHRLEQNALADWLGRIMLKIRPYSTLILTLAVVAAVVFGAASWWVRSSAQGNEAAWDSFYTALNNATNSGDPRPLKQLVDRYRGTDVAYWAAVTASEIHLARGTAEILANRADAIAEIKNAQEGFSLVADECRDPRLRERALYGRARSYEALAGTGDVEGNLARATADYEQVLALETGSVYAKFAQQRLDQLRYPHIKDFYQKLAAYQPPAQPPAPGVSGPGSGTSAAGTFSEKVLNATELKTEPPAAAKPESPAAAPVGGPESSQPAGAASPSAPSHQAAPAALAPAPASPTAPAAASPAAGGAASAQNATQAQGPATGQSPKP